MNSSLFILHGDDEKIIFSVPSTSSDEPHTVTWDFDNDWLCTCDGCLKGTNFCKHMYQAKMFMEFLQVNLLADDHEVFTGVEL